MRHIHLPWLVLVAILVVPGSAAAQDFQRVQAEIDRTDRRIEAAERVVTGSGHDAARVELDLGVRLQADARTALSQTHPRMALELTLRARQRADRAIAMVNRLPDPDRVVAQLERTQELIDRARTRIEECNDPAPRAVMSTAIEMQRRAQEGARSGHYLAALQLTMGARERVHQALRACHVDDEIDDAAERALQRTDAVIERARDRVGANRDGAARRFYERAVEIQGRARGELRAERKDSSVRLTLSARTFAFRALRRAGAGD